MSKILEHYLKSDVFQNFIKQHHLDTDPIEVIVIIRNASMTDIMIIKAMNGGDNTIGELSDFIKSSECKPEDIDMIENAILSLQGKEASHGKEVSRCNKKKIDELDEELKSGKLENERLKKEIISKDEELKNEELKNERLRKENKELIEELNRKLESGKSDKEKLAKENAFNKQLIELLNEKLQLQNKESKEIVDKVQKTINSILLKASSTGSLDIAEFIVERGADVNTEDEYNRKPIHVAAREGNKNIVEFLLTRGVSINDADKESRTPLHFAAGNLDMIRFLVENGANAKAIDSNGNTILHDLLNNLDAVKYLVNDKDVDIEARNKAEETPLDIAIKSNKTDVIKFLVRKLAEKNNMTPLHWAIENKGIEIVELFIDEYNEEENLLHLAVKNNKLDVAKLLIESGADINGKDSKGYTPLHIAGNLEIVELLLSKGADVYAKSHNGNTPLHTAAAAEKCEVVKLLKTKMDKIDVKNHHNQAARDEGKCKDEFSSRKRRDVQNATSGANKPTSWINTALNSVKQSFTAIGNFVYSKYASPVSTTTEFIPNANEQLSVTPSSFFNSENISVLAVLANSISDKRNRYERLQSIVPYSLDNSSVANERMYELKRFIKEKAKDCTNRKEMYSELSEHFMKIREDLQKSLELEGKHGLDACYRLHRSQALELIQQYKR